MTISNILSSYQTAIVDLNNFISKVHSPATGQSSIWVTSDRVMMTESAFLRMFVIWEHFLEKSFIHYIMGNPSVSGKVFTRYANPKDDEHAGQIIVGLNRYMDWSNPESIRKLSKLFLDGGEPYETSLKSITPDLFDLKIIRNSVAHISSTTSVHLDGLGNRLLRRPCLNISAYDLILSINPNNPNKTILQTYQDILDTAATQISG
jgi:hypothetical protein